MKPLLYRTAVTPDQAMSGGIDDPAEVEDLMLILESVAGLCFYSAALSVVNGDQSW